MLLGAQDIEGASGGMDDRQLRDEVITLFLAGHETTANALAWTWVLLARHPDAERHLHAESRHGARRSAAVGRRTSRACPTPARWWPSRCGSIPPAWTMGRRAVVDYHWAGHDVPAGSLVLMSQWVVHR